MAGSIICGVDGSLDSRAALKVAVDLAERLDARLLATHVVQPRSTTAVGMGGGAVPLLASQRGVDIETGERLLEQVISELGLPGDARTRIEQRVTAGFPAERLADLADEERAELIVVGSRGRGAFKAAFLGSVSHDVVGVSPVPVVVVPHVT